MRPNGNDDICLHSLSLYLLCWAPFTPTGPNGNDDISLHTHSLYLLCWGPFHTHETQWKWRHFSSLSSLYLLCWGPHDDYSFEGTGRACCSLEHVARLKIPNSPSVWSYLLNTRKIQRKDDIFNHLWIAVEHLVILSYRGKLYKKVFLFQCSAQPVTQQHSWRYNNEHLHFNTEQYLQKCKNAKNAHTKLD